MNSKDMQGKDAKKNRNEKKIRIKDNTLRLFDCNNTLEIFSSSSAPTTAVLMKPHVPLRIRLEKGGHE